jgi:hypothetical protein
MGTKTPVTKGGFFRQPLRDLQAEPPIDPSSLTRWRKRLGEAGVEELLAETIEAAKRADVMRDQGLEREARYCRHDSDGEGNRPSNR